MILEELGKHNGILTTNAINNAQISKRCLLTKKAIGMIIENKRNAEKVKLIAKIFQSRYPKDTQLIGHLDTRVSNC